MVSRGPAVTVLKAGERDLEEALSAFSYGG